MITFIDIGKALLSSKWIFAKTMPQNPHWYTLRRDWVNGITFDDVVIYMRNNGYKEYYKGRPYTMLNVNDYKYWTMGSPLAETILINKKQRMQRCDYDRIAHLYDGLFVDNNSKRENAEIMEMIDGNANTVLDIGCGTGLFLDYRKPENYVGIDPSRKMLDVLQKKHPNSAVIQTRFEDFVAGKYDLVVSLFGSASYIKLDCINRIKDFVNVGGSYFIMFYKPDYFPATYIKTGVTFRYFAEGHSLLQGSIIDYRNYLIVSGKV